jgi:hypothetical protein
VTTSSTVSAAPTGPQVSTVTTTPYIVQGSDRGKLVVFNGTSIAVTLATAAAGTSASTFGANFYFQTKNVGSTDVTITPTPTSTIDGNLNFALHPGSSVLIFSDNSNYFTIPVPIDTGGVTIKALSSYTFGIGDKSQIIVMTAGSPLNLPGTPPSSTWYATAYNGNTSSALLVTPLSPAKLNGATSSISLQRFQSVRIYTDGTNYFTDGLPLAAGSNISLTTASNAMTVDTANPLPSSISAVSHNFLTSYTASTGVFTQAQPSFADISGTATTSQLPNIPLNQIVSPTASVATFANGDNPLVFDSQSTTAGRIANTFGETTAATSTGTPYEVKITTLAGSTASPLEVDNSLNGAQTQCTLCVFPTWSTTAAVDAGILENVTNTGSGANSKIMDLQVAGTPEFTVDTGGNLRMAGNMGTTNNSTNAIYTASSGTSTSNAALAGTLVKGEDNSNTGSSAVGGFGILRGGMLTGASPAGAFGATQVVSGYNKGTVAAAGDVVCGNGTTAFSVTDCSKTGPALNIVGIAQNSTAPIAVVSAGIAVVATDGTGATVGHVLCMGTTTDGQAHDNGTGACTTGGAQIGVVIATSGSIATASGNSTTTQTLSANLPLVALHFR